MGQLWMTCDDFIDHLWMAFNCHVLPCLKEGTPGWEHDLPVRFCNFPHMFTQRHGISPPTEYRHSTGLTNTGWWFQPSWTVLVNGKDYPIYYGKINMFQTTNQIVPRFSISSNFSGVTTESWFFSSKRFFLYHLYPSISYIIHQNLYKSVSDKRPFANVP